MGSITPEYIKQALGLQQLLDIYDYDVSRVVRHLIKAQPVITPIRSGDVKPLEGYAGIKATAEALETAWAALLEYESTGSFSEENVNRISSRQWQDIGTEVLRDTARLSATVLYSSDRAYRDAAKQS